uniref:Uncharacterized protein n=1 Tax=Glossina austeni TaxID=7395 RepID=A0A1A9UDH5_GLOAU
MFLLYPKKKNHLRNVFEEARKPEVVFDCDKVNAIIASYTVARQGAYLLYTSRVVHKCISLLRKCLFDGSKFLLLMPTPSTEDPSDYCRADNVFALSTKDECDVRHGCHDVKHPFISCLLYITLEPVIAIMMALRFMTLFRFEAQGIPQSYWTSM